MAWDAKSLDELSEVSPFVSGSRTRPMEKFTDPLAASTAFAAREDYVFPTQELEDEEVVEKLPGYALEETLRSIHDEPVVAHETFEPEGEVQSYESGVGDEAFSGPQEEHDNPQESAKDTALLKVVADEAVKWGFLPASVATAIKNGERDEVTLTDLLFAAHHPDLGDHYKIKPGENALREEWKGLRATIHRVLRSPVDGIVMAPPFVKPTTPTIASDVPLRDCIKAHIPAPLRVSLMDLTDPANLVCAGVDDTVTTFAASMAKVLPMYAAFELRARVRDAFKTIPTSVSVANALRLIQRAWQPVLDTNRPANAKAFKGFPHIERVLKIETSGGSWKVEFQSKGDVNASISASQREFAGAAILKGKFGFHQLMELMITFSNDEAAGWCIRALSYEYINALLVQAGLYVPGTGGLWLGAPYGSGLLEPSDPTDLWMAEPTMTEGNASRRFQVGTPKGFATLFAWIALGRLVDPVSSSEMLDLLTTGISDFIKDDLDQDGRTVSLSRTKIGLIASDASKTPDPYYWAQTSLIERDLGGGKKLRYVMSIMNGGNGLPADKTFVSPMDECIVKRHP